MHKEIWTDEEWEALMGTQGRALESKLDDRDEKERTMELSKRDSIAFVEAIQNPSEPNEALKEAARLYKERIDNETKVGEEQRDENN